MLLLHNILSWRTCIYSALFWLSWSSFYINQLLTQQTVASSMMICTTSFHALDVSVLVSSLSLNSKSATRLSFPIEDFTVIRIGANWSIHHFIWFEVDSQIMIEDEQLHLCTLQLFSPHKTSRGKSTLIFIFLHATFSFVRIWDSALDHDGWWKRGIDGYKIESHVRTFLDTAIPTTNRSNNRARSRGVGSGSALPTPFYLSHHHGYRYLLLWNVV